MIVRKLTGSLALLLLCAAGSSASADICNGCSGGGSGTGEEPASVFGVLSVSNGHFSSSGSTPGPSRGEISIPDSGTIEGSSCRFRIHRDGKANRTVSVDWRTQDGTAKTTGENNDYVPGSGTVTMKPGVRDAFVFVQTNPDKLQDDGEHFFVILKRRSTKADVEDHRGKCAIHEPE